MGRLLAAYKAGGDTNTALIETTGLNLEEFQLAWWEWLGGAPGAYPTPPASARVATPRPPAERPTVPPPVILTPTRPAQPSDAFAVGPLRVLACVGVSCVCGALALGALVIVIALARRAAR